MPSNGGARSDDAQRVFVRCDGRSRQRRRSEMFSGGNNGTWYELQFKGKAIGKYANELLVMENEPGSKRRGELLVKLKILCT